MSYGVRTILTGWKEPEGIEEKMKTDLQMIPELAKDGYEHKKEQFYLMHLDGRSDQFLDYFRLKDVSVGTEAMDVIRCAAKLCGEDFAEETLLYRSFTLEEAISKITDELTKRRYERLPEIQQKLDALLQLEEDLIQMKEFLQKKNALPAKEENGKEAHRESTELEHQKRIMDLERKLQEKTAELKAKDMEIASLKTEGEMKLASVKAEYEARIRYMKLAFDRDLDRQLEKGRRALEKERSMNQGGFFRKRSRIQEAEKGVPEESETQDESIAMFLVKVLSGNKYGENQLDVITAAVGEGLSIEELRCMCNPEMPASSMKRLKEFFLKRKGETEYGI